MNISGVQNYGLFSKPLVSSQNISKESKATVTNPIQSKAFASYPIGYIPYQINFGATKAYQTLPEILQLKRLKELPCIYCGQKMVPSTVLNELDFHNNKVPRTLKEFVNKIGPSIKSFAYDDINLFNRISEQAKKTPDVKAIKFINKIQDEVDVPDAFIRNSYRDMTTKEYTKRIIDVLSPYEDAMRPVEKAIFKEIKKQNSSGIQKSLQDIMNDLRGGTIGTLAEKQTNIISEIEKIATEELSKSSKAKVLDVTQEARKLLLKESTNSPYKRKTFLRNLSKIKGTKEDFSGLLKIKEIADKVPTSDNDISAFIAKYSNKDFVASKNEAAKQRSNEEIAKRLVNMSIASVEHIKTQSSFGDKAKQGELVKDSIENLALSHRYCNSMRDNMSLNKYIQMNPEVKGHIQEHINFVYNAAKKGDLENMDNYAQQLIKAYDRESNGRLKFTLPKDTPSK